MENHKTHLFSPSGEILPKIKNIPYVSPIVIANSIWDVAESTPKGSAIEPSPSTCNGARNRTRAWLSHNNSKAIQV